MQKVVINYVERQFSVVQWWNEESNVLCVLDKVRGEEGRKALIKDLEEKEFPCKIGVGNLFENIADSEREKDIVSLLLVLGEKFDVKEKYLQNRRLLHGAGLLLCSTGAGRERLADT